jgi:Flp pilus assembly protein TadB
MATIVFWEPTVIGAGAAVSSFLWATSTNIGRFDVGIGQAGRLGIACAVPVLCAVVIRSPLVGGVGVVFVIGAARGMRSARERRVRARREQELPVVIELIAQRLRSGCAVAAAIDGLSASQLAVAGLDRVHAEIRAGATLAAAMDRARAASGLLKAALLAVDRSGGAGARTVERLADRLRLSAAGRAEARAQSGQQLSSAWVMAGLPPMVTVFYGLADPSAAAFYLRHPVGAGVVVLSLGLSGLSWLWMTRILRTGRLW